jgi:hypothetical protein
MRHGLVLDTMGGMTFRSRLKTRGAVYVVLAMAFGTAAAVDSGGYGFYVAAIVATFPSCLILVPFYPLVVMSGMAASMANDGSGTNWVIVTVCALGFGAAAVLNLLLARLVAGYAGPCWVRLRRLVSRA